MMKDEDSIPFEPVTDEVAEARIVAWVLGEASASEAEDLERLCAEQPELDAFRRRMMRLHGLLTESGMSAPVVGWKLPDAKLQALNDLFDRGAAAAEITAKPPGKLPKWTRLQILGGIAASIVAVFVVLQVALQWNKTDRWGGKELASARENRPMTAPAKADSVRLESNEILRAAIRAQEEKVEQSRRRLSEIIREKGIVQQRGGAGGRLGVDDDAAARSATEYFDPATAQVQPEVNPSPSTASPEDALAYQDEKGGAADQWKPSLSRIARPRIVAKAQPPAAPAAPAEAKSELLGMNSADQAIERQGLDGLLKAPAAMPSEGKLAQVETEPGSDFERDVRFKMLRERLPSPAEPKNKPMTELLDRLDEMEKSLKDAPPADGAVILPAAPPIPGQLVLPPQIPGKSETRMKVMDPEETSAASEPFSTFSLNLGDVSFQLAKAALEAGGRPDPASIKVEQFYNAVDYGDPAPSRGEPVAGVVEQSAHPVIPGRSLVRLGVRAGSSGRTASQPLRLTLLIDQSGSMVREDRKAAMTEALSGLAELLTARDQVSVVGFSRTPRLLAESLPGNELGKFAVTLNQEANENGTNLEEAIQLAGTLATANKRPGGQNRIVLFTDGAANLGNADPGRLAERVKALRQGGIAFDIAGIGADGLNDRLLAELARHGNGRYYVAADRLAEQLAGAFRPAAEDVKVQVRFNPARVSRYRLIGFDENRLKTEDFRNDAVDAAEMAAGEAGIALYQVEPMPDGRGEIGEMSVRFRQAGTGEIVERRWTIPYQAASVAFDRASPSMQLAGLSMLAAESLRGGPLAESIDYAALSVPVLNVKNYYKDSIKVSSMMRVIGILSRAGR